MTSITEPVPRIAPDAGRKFILAIVLTVQLMIAVDITVVNIALPQIQHHLNFSPAGLSWVINAYTLSYGGLLLLGGRLGDILGHRRALLLGVLIFTAASLFGGFAQAPWWLLTARVLQGAGGALAAPSTLAITVAAFPDEQERTKAFGIFTIAQGLGSASGLLLGGLLTDVVSWRWVLFVNVPIGLIVMLATVRYITAQSGQNARFDVGGAVTGTVGITAIVYGFVHAAGAGWQDSLTAAAFTVGLVLVAAFIAIEARHPDPLLPLRLFADRDRTGGFLVFVCSGAAMFGMFFFLTQFVQNVENFSPLTAAFAFLPMAAPMIFIPGQLTPRLVQRFGARATMMLGLGLIAVGMIWLTQITGSTSYFEGVFGPMLLAGSGVGLLNPPLTGTIMAAVPPADSGVAAGALQAVGMIGGSVGTSILVTIFGSSTRGNPLGATAKPVLAQGIATACIGGAAFAALGILIVMFIVRSARPQEAVPG
jgi:EmrB/QacA subfamily drug resistance transporter